MLIGAVLGSYFLNEELGTLGKLGSAICLIGAVVIVLHAPPDEEIETIDQILHYAIQPGESTTGGTRGGLLYTDMLRLPSLRHRRCRIRRVHDLQDCPRLWQEERPRLPLYLLYRRINLRHVCQGFRYCSEAYLCWPQPIHPPVNLRLHDPYSRLHLDPDELLQQGSGLLPHQYVSENSIHDANSADRYASVNPLYYVTFTTATLCASFILFSGFNTTDPTNTLSLICGFLTTFTGVYLLNLSRGDPHGHKLVAGRGGSDATGTDMVSGLQTRLSMSARRSGDPSRHSMSSQHGDRQGLIRAYDEEEAAGFGLTDLADDSDNETRHANGNGNGKARYDDSIELDNRNKSGDR